MCWAFADQYNSCNRPEALPTGEQHMIARGQIKRVSLSPPPRGRASSGRVCACGTRGQLALLSPSAPAGGGAYGLPLDARLLAHRRGRSQSPGPFRGALCKLVACRGAAEIVCLVPRGRLERNMPPPSNVGVVVDPSSSESVSAAAQAVTHAYIEPWLTAHGPRPSLPQHEEGCSNKREPPAATYPAGPLNLGCPTGT